MPGRGHMRLKAAAAILMAVVAASPAVADDDHKERRNRERDREINQDAVRDAVQRGEIRPLTDVLKAGEAAMPGQVLGVKLKKLNGRLVYELKILTGQGRVREVYVDGASLEIIKVE